MHKKWFIGIGALVVAAIPVVLFIVGSSKQAEESQVSIQEALARQLLRPSDLLHLSLPPVDGRYPGAIIVRDDFNRALPVSFVTRPDSVPEATFEVEGAANSSAAALLKGQAGKAGIETSAGRRHQLSVKLREGRVFLISLPEIRAIIAADADAQRLLKKKRDTEIVVRAYEAKCDLVVRRDSALSSKQWMKFRDASLDSGATLAANDSLVFRGEHPCVVAYETMSVRQLADDFAPKGKTLKVNQKVAVLATQATHEPASDVVVACVGSSHYKSFADLPAASCTELVSSSLNSLGYETVLNWNRPTALSASDLDAWFETLEATLMERKPDALVVYWAGHSVSLANGMLYLVLGSYEGNLKVDIGSADGRLRVEERGQPLAGSNIDDILKVLQAVEEQAAKAIKGLLPLATFYRRLEEFGLPFSVLVDGCYESEAMDEIRQELYLTEWGDYFGPDVPDLSRYAAALKRFGQRPTLQGENPVVLAAKPGKTAQVIPNPAASWSHAEGVGPLAARIHRASLLVAALDEPQNWSWLLGLLADQVRGLGEISPEGTVTWSQWGRFETLPLWPPRR